MISFEHASEITLREARTLPCEAVPLSGVLGRVLAEDVVSDIDMPVYHMSAMDGFACRKADLDMPLKMVETIPAGYMPEKTISHGECSKIMTGAVVPEGADMVVMVEHTAEEREGIIIQKKTGRSNIRYRAEDITAGECVLKAGTLISPVEIAVLAGAGCDPVTVSSAPLVGVIATGDELVEPREKPQGARIRNSNGYQLCAQVERMGCRSSYLGIAPDRPEVLDDLFKQALKTCDVILLSGGVSVGDFDYVPDVLRQNNIRLLFEKVSVKPGKPTVFGMGNGRYMFGLPGNPVSTFVLFEVMVKPFLYKLMGHDHHPLKTKARLNKTIKKKKVERSEFIPVLLGTDGTVGGFEYHGSAHIHAYTRANGIMSIPAGIGTVEKGKAAEVILL